MFDVTMGNAMPLQKMLKYVKALPEETEDGNICKYICGKLNFHFKGNGVFSSIFAHDDEDYVFRISEIIPNEDGPQDAWWEYIRDFSKGYVNTPTVIVLKRLTRQRYVAICEKLYTYNEFVEEFNKYPNIDLDDLRLLREGSFDPLRTKLKDQQLFDLLLAIQDKYNRHIYDLDMWGDNLLFNRCGTPIVNDPVSVKSDNGEYRTYIEGLKGGTILLKEMDDV